MPVTPYTSASAFHGIGDNRSMRIALALWVFALLVAACAGDVTTTDEALDGGRDLDWWGRTDL